MQVGEKARLITIYNNEGIEKVISHLRVHIEEGIAEGDNIMVVGDFNARIGERQINSESDLDLDIDRRLEDNIVNAEGNKLLDFCEEYGYVIRNGCTKGDWKGSVTYVGERGSSVLDLVLEVANIYLSLIKEMKVNTRVESDHLPVEIVVRFKKELREVNNTGEKGNTFIDEVPSLKWNDEKRNEYLSKMQDLKIESVDGNSSLQDRWEKSFEASRHVAKELGMIKKKV